MTALPPSFLNPFPMDLTDQVVLSPELVEAIRVFAKQTAPLLVDEDGLVIHHVHVTPETQIAIAVERVFRLLIEGEDADSIRSLTKSPYDPH